MQDKPVYLVTGASAGIGLAVTEGLLSRGARVVMLARTQATLHREASRLGEHAIAWQFDVGDISALEKLPAAVLARFGRIDGLINNAGLHYRGALSEMKSAQLEEMVRVNLTAPMVLSHAVAPHLPKGGAIINIASIAGMLPLSGGVTYSSTKAGLRFFTRAMAEEYPHLRISVVSPGPVDTGFFGEELPKVSDIVFSQPLSTAAQIADGVLKCLEIPSTDMAIPAMSGKLATLGYLIPSLHRALRPMMTRRGAESKKRYMQLVESRKKSSS